MTDQPANQPPESADNYYDRLLEKWKRIAYLQDVEEVLSWDEYTVLPEGERRHDPNSKEHSPRSFSNSVPIPSSATFSKLSMSRR